MTNEEHWTEYGFEASRRTFIKATATTSVLAGVGARASAASQQGGREPGPSSNTAPRYLYGSDGYVYNWKAATQDAYWYSLFNLGALLTFGGNGVQAEQVAPEMIKQRQKAILETAGLEELPIMNPNIVVAPYTTGDPHYTQKPKLMPKPDADTLTWDVEQSSEVVSPASVAWPMLKAVTWAKNFENHFGALPHTKKQKFRTMKLGTQAQMAIKVALIEGKLRANDDDLTLVSEFRPSSGEIVDETPRPNQHAAMLWFLSDMVSLATGGWYGYENPEPMIPAKKIQSLTDGMAKTIVNQFEPDSIVEMGSIRDVGLMLGGMGWYGTHAGDEQVKRQAVEYTRGLADMVASNCGKDGAIDGDVESQAGTQGVVGQGLLWASEIDGVDRTDAAEDVLSYLVDDLWDEDPGMFTTEEDTITITAQEAGDVTGGLNAADAVLEMDGAQDVFTTYFENVFNRGRLQRAQKLNSLYPSREYVLPLPPKAGGEFGQAPVYNTEVEYDADADEWDVTDDTFTTGPAIYLANQDVWISNWSGGFYKGRGIPGQTDEPITDKSS